MYLGYKGKIKVCDLYAGDKDTVTIKFKTVFGNGITKEYEVDHYVTSKITVSGSVNTTKVGKYILFGMYAELTGRKIYEYII